MDRREFLSGPLLAVPTLFVGRWAERRPGALRPPGGDGTAGITVGVMDAWFEHAQDIGVAEQVALVKRLGLAGMAVRWASPEHERRLAELRKQGLGLSSLLVEGSPGASLQEAVDFVKGSKAWIWTSLEIPGRAASDPLGDPGAAQWIASCADHCTAAGLPGIALLPRAKSWMSKTGDVLRLAERLDRPDVGVVFDLHAWMMEGAGQSPRGALEALGPWLRGVVVHGSATAPSILPLGEGDYDVEPVVGALFDLKFPGQIVLAAERLEIRIPERLAASLKKWESLRARALVAAGEQVRAHVYISGIVQGVSFRASTQEQAQRLRVTGWVRNLDDGRVEAAFEGPRGPVSELLKWCHRGPAAARVDKVLVTWEKPVRDSITFEIRH